MTYELVVVQSFGTYPVGALVSDPAQVTAILGSEHARRVVRIALAQRQAEQQTGGTH